MSTKRLSAMLLLVLAGVTCRRAIAAERPAGFDGDCKTIASQFSKDRSRDSAKVLAAWARAGMACKDGEFVFVKVAQYGDTGPIAHAFSELAEDDSGFLAFFRGYLTTHKGDRFLATASDKEFAYANEHLRLWLASALSDAFAAQTCPELGPALAGSSRHAAAWWLETLVKRKCRSAVQTVAPGLFTDEHAGVRRSLCAALSSMGINTHVKAMRTLAQTDADLDVRLQCRDAIGKLQLGAAR